MARLVGFEPTTYGLEVLPTNYIKPIVLFIFINYKLSNTFVNVPS